MKIIILSHLFLIVNLISINISGKENNIDSLLKELKKQNDGVEKIIILNNISDYYLKNNPKEAENYANKAIVLAKKINNISQLSKSLTNKGIAQKDFGNFDKAMECYNEALKIEKDSMSISEIYINIGVIYENQTKFDDAIKYNKKSLEIKEKLKDLHGISICYNNIGVVLRNKGSYEEAIKYYLKALKINEELNDKKGIGLEYNNIANIYNSQKIYNKSLEFYQKALNIFNEIDYKAGIVTCLNNIGVVYYYEQKYDDAIIYYRKAIAIFDLLGNKSNASLIENNIGMIYQQNGEYEKAIESYNKCYNYSKESNNVKGIVNSYNNLAVTYTSLKKYDLAIRYSTLCLDLSIEKGLKNEIKQSYLNLFETYQKTGNDVKALQYHILYTEIKDSLYNESIANQISELDAKYQNEKKQLLIEKLEQQKKLDKETILLQEAETKKQRIIMFSFVIGFLVISVFSIFLYRLFIHKQKANVIITHKNKELEQANEEISSQRDEIEAQRDLVTIQKEHIEDIHKDLTDSINYAERIQRSFLATKELLDENLNEYFVFYQPKDIVSGDFYWASKLRDGNFALATADSTGHGVPGAIMSILNISSLEKAVDQNLCNPSEILNKTRQTIIERLKKDGSPDGGKDGMDASLICFDFANLKFTYSAANNPIWVVRENSLIELSPEKMPIGKHDKDQISFTQQDFKLFKNDVIYTFTDGLPDQFGGPNGKKFMYKQFKEVLLKYSQKSMLEQKNAIDNTFNNWKGAGEQIDDVTVLGIRI